MRSQLLLLGALGITWALQASTAWNRPDEGARTELIQSLSKDHKPGEEIAFSPEWEWGWAHRIHGVIKKPKLRLGRHDLHRPHRGLWLILGPNSSSPPATLGSPERSTRYGPYELRFYRGDQGATPLLEEIAWGRCRTTARRTACREGKGEIRRGEVIFDGRFAHGYKLKLPPSGQATLIIDPKDAKSLVGGIGHTDHGARHGQAPVQLAVRQGDELLFRYAYQPKTGLRPFHLRLDRSAPLRFEFSTSAPDRNEMALSLGLQ
ncbi:MAG: hypothetical protein CMH55_04380 [Myxococcales bacterium]|nr:hypothetical protein [Myxococcales bacterium]